MAQSVVMNPSMVAMLGSIMPEPLHMPPTVTVLPPMRVWTAASMGLVSVVITALSAARPAACPVEGENEHGHRRGNLVFFLHGNFLRKGFA